MSEAESGVGADSVSHECEEGSIWDEHAKKCVPIAEASGKDPEASGEVTADLGLTKRIERTINAYFDKIEKRLNKMIDEKMTAIVKAKEDEIEESLRKSFGLDKDAPVHMSDLAEFARKLQLDTAQKSKRVPATKGSAGPEGNGDETNATESTKTMNALLKEYGVKD